jgi:hypothetical protein
VLRTVTGPCGFSPALTLATLSGRIGIEYPALAQLRVCLLNPGPYLTPPRGLLGMRGITIVVDLPRLPCVQALKCSTFPNVPRSTSNSSPVDSSCDLSTRSSSVGRSVGRNQMPCPVLCVLCSVLCALIVVCYRLIFLVASSESHRFEC